MKVFENRKPKNGQAFEAATVGAAECKPLWEGEKWKDTTGNGDYYILGVSVKKTLNVLKDISIVALGFIAGSLVLQAAKYLCNHLTK